MLTYRQVYSSFCKKAAAPLAGRYEPGVGFIADNYDDWDVFRSERERPMWKRLDNKRNALAADAWNRGQRVGDALGVLTRATPLAQVLNAMDKKTVDKVNASQRSYIDSLHLAPKGRSSFFEGLMSPPARNDEPMKSIIGVDPIYKDTPHIVGIPDKVNNPPLPGMLERIYGKK